MHFFKLLSRSLLAVAVASPSFVTGAGSGPKATTSFTGDDFGLRSTSSLNQVYLPANYNSEDSSAGSLTSLLPASADENRTKAIKFERGQNSAVISGRITGRDSMVYKLNAREGQFLKVSLVTDKNSADFNIYLPGRGPGDEALFASAMVDDRQYLGQLYKKGHHSISVFLNRKAAREGVTANYKLHVSITDKRPVEEEVPATGPVPQNVIDDCLIALRQQVGQEIGMKVISAKRGETSFIIDVVVDSGEKPWRCYHDGTKCTGTEYQGED